MGDPDKGVHARMISAAVLGIEFVSSGVDKVSGQIDALGKRVGGFNATMLKAGRSLTTGVTLPILGFAAFSVDAASDLQESQSKVVATFGQSSQAILNWSKNANTAFGLTKSQALDTAGSMGALLQGMGFAQDKSGQMAQGFIGAAADLASFHNVAGGVPAVLDAITSALVGEYDPIQRLGIAITAATVEQRAMADTGKTVASTLTEQEKAAARYALIMEGLGPAAGDWARTQGGLANQTRIAKAAFTDAAATLGVVLLPAVTRMVSAFAKGAQFVQGLSGPMGRLVVIFGLVAAAIGPMLILIGTIGPAFMTGVKAVQAFSIAMRLLMVSNPILLVLTAAIAAFAIAYKTNFLGFGDAVRSVFGGVLGFVGRLVEGFRAAREQGLDPFSAALKGLVAAIFGIGGDNTPPFLVGIGKAIQALIPLVQRAVRFVREFVSVARRFYELRGIAGVLDYIGIRLRNAFGENTFEVFLRLRDIIGDVITGVVAHFTNMAQLIANLLRGDLGGAFREFGELVRGDLSAIWNVFSGTWSLIFDLLERVPVIGGVVSWIRDTAAPAISGLWGTAQTAVDGMLVAFGMLKDKIKPLLDPVLWMLGKVVDLMERVGILSPEVSRFSTEGMTGLQTTLQRLGGYGTVSDRAFGITARAREAGAHEFAQIESRLEQLASTFIRPMGVPAMPTDRPLTIEVDSATITAGSVTPIVPHPAAGSAVGNLSGIPYPTQRSTADILGGYIADGFTSLLPIVIGSVETQISGMQQSLRALQHVPEPTPPGGAGRPGSGFSFGGGAGGGAGFGEFIRGLNAAPDTRAIIADVVAEVQRGLGADLAATVRQAQVDQAIVRPFETASRDVKPQMASFTAAVTSQLTATRTQGASLVTQMQRSIAGSLAATSASARSEMASFNSSISAGMAIAQFNAARGGFAIGLALSQGAAAGVRAAAGQVAAEAAAMVNQAIFMAQLAALTFSPSHRTRDEIGRPLIQGIIVGMRAERDNLYATMRGLVDGIPMAPPAFAGAGAGNGESYRGGASQTIHQTNYIEGRFASGEDWRRQMNELSATRARSGVRG